MFNNMVIPASTQQLIMKEREKMLNNVVKVIGRISEEITASMGAVADDEVIVEVPVEETKRPEIEATTVDTAELINTAIEKTLDSRLKTLLHDVDYRINLLYDVLERAEGRGNNRIGSRDLNLAHHILDGFTFNNNQPVAGSVSWVGCHVVYKGTDYTITDGNSNKKYIYWALATPTVFTTSDTKPTLTLDDVLIGTNEGGTFYPLLTPGKLTTGSTLVDGTVGTNEIGTNAVTGAKIANGAVGSAHVADNAISAAKILDGAVGTGKLAANAVDNTILAANAVTSGKIATGAISNSAAFATGVVNNAAIAATAVDSGKLATGAVTAGKIASGAVNNANLFTAGVVNGTALATGAVTDVKIGTGAVTNTKIADNAVDTNKLANNAVTAANISDGAVTGTKIGAGAIGESKLNLATHLLY
ncbi:hypothetical protein Dtox_1850 [Desulfofarcimen acetoxidans DSM 771]|uniref:Uncharacterized protein n=1 Tax=Desulfofarcimen acetoxidans (strain ATCC 49208 / DSM 771 / KCTC 5769 / VKM B-1644 / 5575) TaxID=485916 RepID=C8VXP1_DESAS|nr:hypothetical protein [Desulfofarcimen acetoxidans]ACV62697.1 hypothetical protein Dtox_1850 [Desulfofarcimen acetoxidans DSM 771]